MPSRAKAKAKAKAQNLRPLKSQRQKNRRLAVQELNNLSTEVDLPAPRLPSKSATPAEVEKVIRLLEPRCQAATLFPRLRAAATQWSDNGGHLSRALLPEPAGDDTTTDAELSPVLQHKVLAPGFTLQSKAFMATFNNRTWSRSVWAGFLAWVKSLKPKLGFHAWAACMEISKQARPPLQEVMAGARPPFSRTLPGCGRQVKH